MGLSYTESKSIARKTIIILAIITIGEVLFALLGKGHLISGVHFPVWIMGGVMIALSLYKAYLIIYEFMHMKYEISGLVRSVLLPLILLIWAIIAFSYEGTAWKSNRDRVTASEVDGRPVISEPIRKIKAHDTHHGHDTHGSHDKGGHH